MFRLLFCLSLLSAGVCLAQPTESAGGRWLTPDWPSGAPRFKPVPLYWFEVKETPLVYRKVVSVPKGCDRAVALLRTRGYAYVCVDGNQGYAWAPRPRSDKAPAVPADPNRVHLLDLSSLLVPGQHVLTVSAPEAGFVLDGGLYQGTKRLASLATDGSWTVTRFRPTSIVEDQPIMRLSYDGKAIAGECASSAPVKEGEAWQAPEENVVWATHGGIVGRAALSIQDALWKVELLARKGIYVVGDAAYGWGGAGRADAEAVREASRLVPEGYQLIYGRLQGFDRVPSTMAELRQRLPSLRAFEAEASAYSAGAERACRLAMDADEAKALALAATAVPGFRAPDGASPAELRARLEKTLGHPQDRLNESRYDRLGWMPNPQFADSQVSAWGIRINPVTGPTRVQAPWQWLFSTDPNNQGERELRWSIGYNIEGQMGRIAVPSDWAKAKDAALADYRGVAWYRTRIRIPDEWAGNEVVITFGVSGTERFWINDKEITQLGSGAGQRTYKLPASVVAYGAENFLALRVDARGEQRGITGGMSVSCPALEGPQGKQGSSVTILTTPLSPCVLLTPRTDTVQIYHAGTATLRLPGAATVDSPAYDAAKGDRLRANWVLLWLKPGTPAGVERPILLVFQKNPAGITCEEGVTRIRLAGPGQRVIAVRPWAKLDPTKEGQKLDLAGRVALWSQAALAVPINYMTITRVLRRADAARAISVENVPKGPLLEHIVIYDYLLTKDDWGTRPLKLAPLPALCSMALDTHFRTLEIDGRPKVEELQDGGLAALYRGVRGADRVSYRYEVEPWPRFAGFTSYMFSPADAGVPGNEREMQLIAAIGANSYRPQHNWSDQRPGRYNERGQWEGYFPEAEKRTRVQITADFCNAVGINYMNNVEQTLDKRELCRNDYDTWLKTVLFPHFEKLVPQLANRPFWAVAYDLVNEPFDHKAPKYNPAMRELTRRVRAMDKTHLCYIEPCQSWGAVQQIRLTKPTGDPLTMYSFHDYNFRLSKSTDRWPTLDTDVSSICQLWWPAFEFAVKHGTGMHCGEFGNFGPATDDSLAQKTLLNDFFRIFDQFGMHHNYYSGREVYERLADGSCRPSNVVRTYREYFRRPDFNAYYSRWPGQPAVPPAP